MEYIDNFPNTPSVHGNSKSSNAEYVRTSEATKIKLVKKVNASSVAPRQIYEEMVLDDSRDLKQAQNAKHLEKRKIDALSQKTPTKTSEKIRLMTY